VDPSVEARLDSLEALVQRVLERVESIEQRVGAGPAVRPQEPAAPPRPAEPVERARPKPAEHRRLPAYQAASLEDLLGGRVLAWVGGAAVLLGIVFLVATAIHRGWIDEPTRVVLAFLGSALLFAAGIYLYEAQRRTDAAVAAVAAGIAGLYASDTAATRLYDLIEPALGLAVAGVIGACGAAIAVRWERPLVGALGILGALASPILVDAGTDDVTLAFVAIALASSTAVVLWQRWDWLSAAAFLVSAPQLVLWIEDTYEDSLGLTLAVLLGFWALYLVAAIGYELRVPVARLRASSASLLVADAILVSVVGYAVLDDRGHGDAATAWILALALAHLAAGWGTLTSRASREVGVLAVAISVALSGFGLALALDGPVLVSGWSAEAVLLAWIARRTGERRANAGAAAFLVLAAAHILSVEAPPDALVDGVEDLADALVALAVFMIAAVAAARLYVGDPRELRRASETAAGVAAVYLPSVAIVDLLSTEDAAGPDQTPQLVLSAFWSGAGLAALVFGLVRDDRRFRLGGLVLLAVAAVKVFVYDLSELESLYRVLSFIALGLLLLAGAFAYQRIRLAVHEEGETG
jgi:uncharacterized membrane protein